MRHFRKIVSKTNSNIAWQAHCVNKKEKTERQYKHLRAFLNEQHLCNNIRCLKWQNLNNYRFSSRFGAALAASRIVRQGRPIVAPPLAGASRSLLRVFDTNGTTREGEMGAVDVGATTATSSKGMLRRRPLKGATDEGCVRAMLPCGARMIKDLGIFLRVKEIFGNNHFWFYFTPISEPQITFLSSFLLLFYFSKINSFKINYYGYQSF